MHPKSSHKPFQVAPGSLMYNITACYRDPQSGDFVIIPNTDVIVQNADGTLTEHLTKEMHIFQGTSSSSPATTMMDKNYWQFETDHEKWPYMFVLRSLFATSMVKSATDMDFDSGRQSGKSADQIILDDLGPLMDPLTKRQIKLLYKKNVCPDCKQQGMCWSVGPTMNGDQKYKCANCHAMFNMTPKGTERIKCRA